MTVTKKKYNYFEDDFDELEKIDKKSKQHKSKLKKLDLSKIDIDTSSFSKIKNIPIRKALTILKKVVSVIGMYLLLILKAAGKIFKRLSQKVGTAVTGIIVLLVSVIILLVIITTAVMSSAENQSKKQDEFNKVAYTVCTDYKNLYGITNYKFMNSEYDVQGCMLTGLAVVRQIDFNSDGTSELLLAYNDNDKYYTDIWGFESGQFKKLYSNKVYQTDNRNDNIWIAIYYDNNDYYIAEHNADDISQVSILKLSDGKFKQKDTAIYDPSNMQYTIDKKDCTEDFELIKFAVLRESTAANVVERSLKAIDDFSNSGTTNTSEKTDTSQAEETAVKNAYYNIINKYNKEYGIATAVTDNAKPYITGLAMVQLVDFDKNGTDELMLVYRRKINERREDSDGNYYAKKVDKYFCEIYTWNNNSIKQVYHSDNISNMKYDDELAYVIVKNEDKRSLLCTNTFARSENEYDDKTISTSKILAFNGETFSPEQKYVVEVNWGYYSYYINSERTYESEFKSKGGYRVPFFDGSSRYDANDWSISYLRGTKADLKKIEAQVKSTEQTIKKINPDYNPENTNT